MGRDVEGSDVAYLKVPYGICLKGLGKITKKSRHSVCQARFEVDTSGSDEHFRLTLLTVLQSNKKFWEELITYFRLI
jgi:hypothetical protein